MNPLRFEEHLATALSMDLDYDESVQRERKALAKNSPIPAAVLLLMGYSLDSEALPSVLYTLRTDQVDSHKGQISFPGGHMEPEEMTQPELTALRETEEEVGIARQFVKVLGRLPSLYTGTGFLIQPFVGILNQPIEKVSLVLDPRETAEAIWAPLGVLLSPGVYQAEKFRLGALEYPIDVYNYRHHRIWGATVSMTKNLLDRLNRVSRL